MNDSNIKKDDYFSLSELYHEKSKMRKIDKGFYSWINHVNTSPDIRRIISRPNYKHKGVKSILLEKPAHLDESKKYFDKTFCGRQSIREFKNDAITFSSLSRILALGNGVTRKEEFPDGSVWSMRTTPSPGGLFPIEIYCVIQNVAGLDSGIYMYSPIDDCLFELRTETRDKIQKMLLNSMSSMKASVTNSSAVVLLASNMQRIKFKYKERAYRFALLETGHIAQNMLLAAESENLGTVCVGGFLDDEVNDIIDADGLDKMVQYCILVGKK